MKKWWIVGTVLVLVLCMGVSGVFAVERRGRFADADGDGVCDNYGAGGGNRYGKNGGKGCGRGKGCQ